MIGSIEFVVYTLKKWQNSKRGRASVDLPGRTR